MDSHVYTGRLSEVALLLAKLKGDPKVKVVLVPENEESEPIPFGIFEKELAHLTEEDFKSAEWHGPKEDEF